MRNFQNQGNSGNGKTHSGNRSGGFNRDNRGPQGGRNQNDNRGNREQRPGGGGYKGNRPDRFEHRSGSGSGFRPSSQSGGFRPRNDRPRDDRGNRFDRPDRFNREGRSDRPEGMSRPHSSWVEVTGRSVEEAVEEAARRFNVNRAELKTETLDEGSKGFLGIGSKPAKVKVALKPQSVIPFAEGVLTRLLRGMSLPDTVKSRRDADGNTVLNIEGPSSGTLIGRHGHTLESLQYLVLKVVQRMTGDEKTSIVVDVENYLERQTEKLRELAVGLAEKAKETGVEIPMRPMSSKDRRIVHLTLKDHEHVTTESRGEGLRRKVVIIPKVKAVVAEAAPAPEAGPASVPEHKIDMEDRQPIVANQPVPEISVPEPVSAPVSTGQPEPGNAIPKEPEVDDSIGNRV